MRLTKAQQDMLDTLREIGPLSDMEMTVNCGRTWRGVWKRLEDQGLVRFAPYAKEGRHYRVLTAMETTMAKTIPIQQQGKIIAEWDQTDQHWLVLFPDGTVLSAKDQNRAEKLARKWFRDHLRDEAIGIGTVEYRKCTQ